MGLTKIVRNAPILPSLYSQPQSAPSYVRMDTYKLVEINVLHVLLIAQVVTVVEIVLAALLDSISMGILVSLVV